VFPHCPPLQCALRKGKFSERIYNASPHTEIEILPHVHDIVWPLPMLLFGGKELEPIGLISE
jgi:hypothetical protein